MAVETRKEARSSGDGPLAGPLQRLLERRRWRLPPLRVLAGEDVDGARGEVVLGEEQGTLFALAGGARPCARCLRLRLAARVGEGGARRHPQALHALLVGLQRRVPREQEALLVPAGAARAVRASLLPHPDCACLARPERDASAARDALLSALRRAPRAPRPGARAAYLDPWLGPFTIEEEPAPEPGRYPLNQPFVWGSVHLTRWAEGRRFDSSTQGGIYASTPSLPLTRQVALSEGVERLAARGARADVWSSAEQARVALSAFETRPRAGAQRARRGFCHGVDLTTGEAALVPLERVLVGAPPGFYPQALRPHPFYTGTASHLTLAEAVAHATVEVLKRDAYTLAWFRRCALRPLAWPKRPGAALRARARYLEERGFQLELFDLRVDFPLPVVLLRATATRAKGNWPKGGAMLAAGGGFRAEGAVEDAVRLIASQYVSIALHPHPLKNPLDPRAVRQMTRLAEFWPLIARYLNPAHASAHAFLGRGQAPMPFESVADIPRAQSARQRLAHLRRWFKARGLQWLAVRLTDPSAHAAGFEVAKVVLPGLLLPGPTQAETDLRHPRLHRPWPQAKDGALNPHPLPGS